MKDYTRLIITFTPTSEEACDLAATYLGEIGYETFETTPTGLYAYIPQSDFSLEKAKTRLDESDFFGLIQGFELTDETIKGEDWNQEWEKNYFKPIQIEDKVVIHSTFHHDFPKCRYEIVIDPKMAFGTGHHATTTLMLTHLLETDLEDKNVLDMGTGTGILAILALMKGAKTVTGIEIDPDAAVNARENVKLNNCEPVSIVTGDASLLENYKDIDIFLANINRNIITADLPRYVKTLHQGSFMILSGYYREDLPIIEREAGKYGLKLVDFKEKDNWVAAKFIMA